MHMPPVDTSTGGSLTYKAATVLGDKSLEQQALEHVSEHAQINKKVLGMVGDANKLAPEAARKRLGSIMTPEAKVSAK